MKIFGIGLSRTGTTSLTLILKESVGISIIHYPGKKQLFDPKNSGACDIPVAIYYKELDKKFPGAKFIYTIREKEQWLNSIEHEIKNKRAPEGWQKENRTLLYGQIEFDRKQFSKRYDAHDKEIKEYFKNREQDLLFLDICGGTDKPETLFSFLGINVENIPNTFPHTNKKRKPRKQ